MKKICLVIFLVFALFNNSVIAKTIKSDIEENNIQLFFLNPLKQKKPQNTCKTNACKALLKNINEANESIDFAIYGINNQDKIFNALIKAQKRGVNIRWVTDLNEKNRNIYYDTYKLMHEIPTYNTDYISQQKDNVREMLENLAQKPQFAGVVYGDTPENYYVHAGIAFYGGGKNYGVLDYNLSGTSKDWTFGGYAVSFADIERSYLTMASGSEDFYFVIYDRATSGFSPMTQKEILASGKAYDCIKNP